MRTIEIDIGELRSWIERRLGLSFSEERTTDLLRAMRHAARELGCANVGQLWRTLLTGAQEPFDVLTRHLTVGETYFFREPRAFEMLERDILPGLLEARRHAGRYLRIWSAGCSTGEEPYSIAITLARVIPDLSTWSVSLFGTDANSDALEFAKRACFRPWAFRETPSQLRAAYFDPVDTGEFQLRPAIRKMVRFSQLNLADRQYPPPFASAGSFDVIFCRNVLLYFSTAAAAAVRGRFADALTEEGWLIASPSDHIRAHPPLVQISSCGAAVFQKQAPAAPPAPTPAVHRVHAPAKTRIRRESSPASKVARRHGPSARQLANEGRLDEALAMCEREIAHDRLNPAHHYLHAIIAIEKADWREAEKSLRRALFLDPGFVIAHYTLATVLQRNGQAALCQKHLADASLLLRRYDSDDVLPESDGLSAGRLAHIIDQSLSPSDDHQSS